jgi:hypothetical protein
VAVRAATLACISRRSAVAASNRATSAGISALPVATASVSRAISRSSACRRLSAAACRGALRRLEPLARRADDVVRHSRREHVYGQGRDQLAVDLVHRPEFNMGGTPCGHGCSGWCNRRRRRDGSRAPVSGRATRRHTDRTAEAGQQDCERLTDRGVALGRVIADGPFLAQMFEVPRDVRQCRPVVARGIHRVVVMLGIDGRCGGPSPADRDRTRGSDGRGARRARTLRRGNRRRTRSRRYRQCSRGRRIWDKAVASEEP